MAEVNNVNRNIFDKYLTKISPCYPIKTSFKAHNDAFYFLNLHPIHYFIWDREIMGDQDVEEGTIALTRWMMDGNNNDLFEHFCSNFVLYGRIYNKSSLRAG